MIIEYILCSNTKDIIQDKMNKAQINYNFSRIRRIKRIKRMLNPLCRRVNS